MRAFTFLPYLLSLALLLTSCAQDSDICTEGGTPRMKVKFKKDGKLYTVPQLFVGILYQNDTLDISKNDTLNVDSLFIPLKVNGEGFTDILVKTDKTGPTSKIRINYKESSEYVSPGCGIRKIYDEVSANLTTPNPIITLESNVNKIHDENTTVFYFGF